MNYRKAVMIGCGYVGAASVFSLMQSGLFSEIALIDMDKEKAEGEAMDISHGIPFSKHMKIYAGDYEDVRDAGIVIITAGANQKPNETRLDLVHKNVAIFKSIIPEIASRDFGGIILVVANPVDILTHVAQKLSAIFYPVERTSPMMIRIIIRNPIYNYIACARQCVLYGTPPTWEQWARLFIWSVGVYVVGCMYFKKMKNRVLQKV